MAETQSPRLSLWAWRGTRVRSHWRMELGGVRKRAKHIVSVLWVSSLLKSQRFPSVQADNICYESTLTLSRCPKRVALTGFLFFSLWYHRTGLIAHGYQKHFILTPNPGIYRFQETRFCFLEKLRQVLELGRAGHDRPSVWQRLLYLRAVWAWTEMFRMISGWVYYSI